jgi:hypothetical protein
MAHLESCNENSVRRRQAENNLDLVAQKKAENIEKHQ